MATISLLNLAAGVVDRCYLSNETRDGLQLN